MNADVQAIRMTRIRHYSQGAVARDGGIDLAIGDIRPPRFHVPAHVRDAAKRALDEGHTYYPPVQGIPELRQAIAAKLARENDLQADADREVLVTTGATEALYAALLSLVSPGDEVLVPDPCHDIYEPMVRLVHGTPVRVPFRAEDDFQMRAEAIESRVTARTRVIWINTPNSPTGAVYGRDTLEAIGRVAVTHDLWILADEPYERFVFDGARHISIASLPGLRDRTATAQAFSKTYGMTGLRVGYLVAPPALTELAMKVHRNVVAGVNLVAQKAAVAALEGPQEAVDHTVAQFDRSRRILVDGLNTMDGIRCTVPRGTFYAYPDVSGLGVSSTEFADLLLEREGVAVVPGDNWGDYRAAAYCRVSFCQPEDVVEEAVGRIRRLVDSLGTRSSGRPQSSRTSEPAASR